VSIAEKQKQDTGVSTFSLGRIGVFAGLPTSIIKSLEELMEARSFRAGEVLFKEGDGADCVYVVHRGIVKIVKQRHNSPVEAARRGPGEIVGEMALLDSSTRFATAICEVDTEFYTLSREQFFGLLGPLSYVAVRIVRTLTTRLRESEVARLETMEAKNQAMQSALALRDNILKATAQPVIITDLATRLKLTNPAAQRMFGVPESHSGLWQWVKTDDLVVRRESVSAAKHQKSWQGKFKTKDIDHKPRYYQITMTPTPGIDEVATECLWVFNELTGLEAQDQTTAEQKMLDATALNTVRKEIDKCLAAHAAERKLVDDSLPLRRAIDVESCHTTIHEALEKLKSIL
jgi:CRP-like cAMP-binding protein